MGLPLWSQGERACDGAPAQGGIVAWQDCKSSAPDAAARRLTAPAARRVRRLGPSAVP
jgi:hypothetical protein